jgi:hypothetical protein
LLEAAAQSSFELEAAEAEGQRYGTHFDLGDRVSVELVTGAAATDVLRQVSISAGNTGVTVKLVPGNPDTTGGPAAALFRQAAIIRALRAQLRALQREE